jgi:hypothetical protein
MTGSKLYCLDTSGLSNPLDTMPERIAHYRPIWTLVQSKIENGIFAVNGEIYEELCRLPGSIGTCLNNNKGNLLLEVGQNWNWQRYLQIVEDLTVRYRHVISEYNGNRNGTVGLVDVSIVALAKTLNLPLISMESVSYQGSPIRMRIPGLCDAEDVQHLTFNDFIEKV